MSKIGLLILAVLSAGCELVVGGYDVAGGSGGEDGSALCGGLPVVASWDFEGADPFEGLEVLGPVAGSASDGVWTIDYADGSTETGGRGYAQLSPAASSVAICGRVRSSDTFTATQLFALVESIWDQDYCGFFVGQTSSTASHLFGVTTLGGGSVDGTEQFGAINALNTFHEFELTVDLAARTAAGGTNGEMLTLDLNAAPYARCRSTLGAGARVGFAVPPSGTPTNAARLEFEELRIGASN